MKKINSECVPKYLPSIAERNIKSSFIIYIGFVIVTESTSADNGTKNARM
jgi:hypothetical protein